MSLRGVCTDRSRLDHLLRSLGNENERARHIRLHERVNALPDANYSTLKYLMGHLHKCVTPPPLCSPPFPRAYPHFPAAPRPLTHAPRTRPPSPPNH